MEYVQGLPITEYCDEKPLSPSERLLLFTKICEGAPEGDHPSRPETYDILVAEVDGKPVPRIIDFGLAKAISEQSQHGTLVTRAGGLVGTPRYMSPEQMDPMATDMDTRADVYSLGVVLYELLDELGCVSHFLYLLFMSVRKTVCIPLLPSRLVDMNRFFLFQHDSVPAKAGAT